MVSIVTSLNGEYVLNAFQNYGLSNRYAEAALVCLNLSLFCWSFNEEEFCLYDLKFLNDIMDLSVYSRT